MSERSRTRSALRRAVKCRAVRAVGSPLSSGMALALPLRQAAVQHAYVLHAHDAEGPPHACGAEQSGRIVDDDARAVADAHAPHARGELLRRRQHMGQVALGVGDLVDVEEQRARNMLREIFGTRVPALGRHMPGGIDDDEVGRIELAGELFGLSQTCLRLRQIGISVANLDKYARWRFLRSVEPLWHRQPLLAQEFGVEQPLW